METCSICGMVIRKEIWVIQLKDTKETIEPYCSKECAKSDAWGPLFRGNRIKKKSIRRS